MLKLLNTINRNNILKNSSILLAISRKNNHRRNLKLISTSIPCLNNMDLKQVVKRLEQYADLSLACDWDNVGK
jgi:hypothetical protein